MKQSTLLGVKKSTMSNK